MLFAFGTFIRNPYFPATYFSQFIICIVYTDGFALISSIFENMVPL
jgi:hypothetical protein